MKPLHDLAAFAFSSMILVGQAPLPRAQMAFSPGGRLTLDLEAGDYDLVPAAGDRVLVSWTGDDEGRARAWIDGTTREAHLVVERTPHQNFHARVEVPARCDLRVRLTAGELKVGPIEGSKDIAMRAGDLRVAVPHPEQYGRVHASVWAGDIHARAFGGERSGLFRSFDHEGPGTFSLRLSTWAGDISLEP
jgi:hypothetical protein